MDINAINHAKIMFNNYLINSSKISKTVEE